VSTHDLPGEEVDGELDEDDDVHAASVVAVTRTVKLAQET
jgi:hypothetical protein